jgi:hypothetical protein
MMTFEVDGHTYTIRPLSWDLGAVYHGHVLVAGYSYDPDKGYHVLLVNTSNEARGPCLIDCLKALLG